MVSHATPAAPGACLRFHTNAVMTSATTAPTNVADATNEDVSKNAMVYWFNWRPKLAAATASKVKARVHGPKLAAKRY
jgi:hypothetical protein